MRKFELKTSVKEYDTINELDSEDKILLKKACKAINTAYAPYSKYFVGAAVLLENGKIITGSNQENVAYPSGMCAERVAIFYASSHYPDIKIKSIAISAKAENFKIDFPVTPCGACRQVLAEYENRQKSEIRLILSGETGKIYVIKSVKNILPMMFHAEQLKK